MSKYVVLSTDDQIDYYSLLPLTCLSWSKLGYTPIVIQVIDLNKENSYKAFQKYLPTETIIYPIASQEGVKDCTTSQVSRLFASSFLRFHLKPTDTIILGDADMVIMKDIFTDEGEVVCYGHDLTDRNEIPMCYVKASARTWFWMMGDNMFFNSNAYSDDKSKYWGSDQQVLTQKLQYYGFDNIKFVDRGIDPENLNLPIGRWDRYNWKYVPQDIIDVHMIRQPIENWGLIKLMAEYLFHNDNLKWMDKYYLELTQ